MKLQLLIEASPSILASILASLPDGATALVAPPSVVSAVAGDDDDASGPVSSAAFDSSGMPWDARIHSEKKGVKADGTWKRRRNTDDATFAAVEAELRAGRAQQTPPPLPPVPVMVPPPPMALPVVPMQPVAPMPVMSEPQPVMVPPPVTVAPPMPLPEVPPQPVTPAAPDTGAVLDFAGFMQHLSPKFAERDAAGQPVITADYLASIAAQTATAYQTTLTALTDLSFPQNAHMVQYAVQLLTRDGRW